MKKISVLFLLSIAITSCQKEAIKEQPNSIQIVAQYASEDPLRTAFATPKSTWIANTDKIGLFSDQAETSPGVLANNVEFTAETSGASTTFTSTTEVKFDGTAEPHSFSAIYPYIAGTISGTSVWERAPISLPAVQTQTGTTTTHIGPLDAMIAKATITPVPGGTNPILNLTFSHVFTILKFDITSANPNTLSQIRLTKDASGRFLSINTGNVINIGQDPPAAGVPYFLNYAGGGTYGVTLNTNLSTSSTVTSAYMVVNPGAHPENFSIVFRDSDGSEYTLPITASATRNFARGSVIPMTVSIPSGGGW